MDPLKEKWILIDEDIPMAAMLKDLEIRKVDCKEEQAIKDDDPGGKDWC